MPFPFFKKPSFRIHFNDGPFVEITSNSPPLKVEIKLNGDVFHQSTVSGHHWTKAHRRYYADWQIDIKNQWGKQVVSHTFNPAHQVVRVNIDSKSLGDTLAWLPQIQAFAQKHASAKVFVSQFWDTLFDQSAYPELNFIQPDQMVADCYATYDLGFYFDNLNHCHPADPRKQPLGNVAADILGIPYMERKPVLSDPTPIPIPIPTLQQPYVCIATTSTAGCKLWQYEGGWQTIVDYLNDSGLDVMVIQKEPCELKGIVNMSGDHPIPMRIQQIRNSEFFIGLGSGLSWLAWAISKPVVLISGFSLPYSEFVQDCERVINTDVCHGCWNNERFTFARGDWDWCPVHKGTERQFECSHGITPSQVIDSIERIRQLKNSDSRDHAKKK